MTDDITIPPEALMEARHAFTEAMQANAMLTEVQIDPIEAACIAMLQAWPGVYTVPRGYPATDIILPLTESTDVEA